MRAGNDRGPLLGLGEHARDVEHVLGLEAEVELLDDRLREQLDQRGRVRERRDRDAPDEMRREPRHRFDVFAYEARDLRALHLDDDVFAGPQAWPRAPARSTPPRSACDRTTREHVVERASEVELDDPAHRVERLGRHPVAQQLELGDELLGEEALAAAHDLSELDVRRAEMTERHPQPPRQIAPRRTAGPCAARPPPRGRARSRPDRTRGPGARAAAGAPSPSSAAPGSRPGARSRSTSPRHVIAVGVDDPRPVIGERTDREIRRDGVGHPETIEAPGTVVFPAPRNLTTCELRLRHARAASAPRRRTGMVVEEQRELILVGG